MMRIRPESELQRLTFAILSTPAKALATCIIVTLALGMAGALGQIVVHDVIPTFFTGDAPGSRDTMSTTLDSGMKSLDIPASASERGDLFADLETKQAKPEPAPAQWNEQLVWNMKWTHIHLFGMNMIFFFMGVITLLLDISPRSRTWLIVLPFAGVMIDILAVWLKGLLSPVYFWLHIPGGVLFAIIFGYVSVRALWEMWGRPKLT